MKPGLKKYFQIVGLQAQKDKNVKRKQAVIFPKNFAYAPEPFANSRFIHYLTNTSSFACGNPFPYLPNKGNKPLIHYQSPPHEKHIKSPVPFLTQPAPPHHPPRPFRSLSPHPHLPKSREKRERKKNQTG